MKGIILEVVAILYLVAVYAMDVEWGRNLKSGEAKLNAVINDIIAQLKDDDGLKITNEFKLKAIRMALPVIINLVVKNANKLKVFNKSS